MDSERFFRCECGADHFLSVQSLDWGDILDWYISIIDVERAVNLSFWNRLWAALTLLRGRNHLWTEILLDIKQVQSLIGELEKAAQSMKASPDQEGA